MGYHFILGAILEVGFISPILQMRLREINQPAVPELVAQGILDSLD